ncbi:protein kinase superfamily protein [Wolffia australiana]
MVDGFLCFHAVNPLASIPNMAKETITVGPETHMAGRTPSFSLFSCRTCDLLPSTSRAVILTEKRRRVLGRILRRLRLSPPSANLGALPFLRRFTYKEIKRATDGFSRVIPGSGGTTYKAHLVDGIAGLVRKVKPVDPLRDDGATAFYGEVLFLSRLHHCHIIHLLGFSEEHGRFLVFSYTENGTLREIIHDPLRTPLTWRARLRIIVDIAASLEYLCLFCDPQPRNLTVSAETIFLDGGVMAKLSAVGLMNVSEKVSRSPADVDSKGDRSVLFQLGALILELVTGQSFGSQGADLVRWIEGSDFSRSMEQMVDSDLGEAYDSGELRNLLSVARLCVSKVNGGPSFSISHVLRFLQSKLEPCGANF